MASEDTPLLLPSPTQHAAVYDRFSPRRKKVIVALVSLAGLLPLFVSGSFIPTIPQIAADLHSTGPIINLAVSLSVFSVAVGSFTFAAYSGFYGRRLMYLCGLPLLCIGSIGVAMSQTVPQLMIWRFLQAFGASGGLSIGTGVIGDIYKLEERGTAMGIFFAAVLLGPTLAPLAGGIVAHSSSWRYMQYALFVWGLISFTLMVLFFPETCHPNTRGIEKLRNSMEEGRRRRWKFVWINPFSALWLLRSPNLLAVILAGTAVLLTDYVLLIPLAYTIGVRYGISNEAIIGACFLPAGIGNIIGAPIAGRMSDQMVIKWKRRRGGKWVPEDRLRATFWGALILVPLSVLFAGLITQFVDGKVGLVLNLICLFINGFGIHVVLSPSAAYCVDAVHARSAEMMAANHGLRAAIIAVAIAGILPSINHIGVAGTNALSAAGAWIGFGLLWCTVRYGDQMRAWVDIGYSTDDGN